MFQKIGMAALAVIVSATAASACANQKAVCQLMLECLQDTAPEREADINLIRSGLSSETQSGIQACATARGVTPDLDKYAAACATDTYVAISAAAIIGTCGDLPGNGKAD